MTEKLKTLLHDRAIAAEFAAPDLDSIVTRGDRTVRRRRGATGIAAVLVTAGAVGVALTVGDGSGPKAVDPATDPVSVAAATWATGSTLHTLQGSSDVGHPIEVYVRTAAGFAFTDPDGVVRTLVDGVVTEVGRSDPDRPRLVADVDGSLVAWTDTSGSKPTYLVTDLAGGPTVLLDDSLEPGADLSEAGPVILDAVDDRTVYLRDGRGAVALEVDTGETTVVDPSAKDWPEIVAAEDGLIAFSGNDGVEVRTPGREPVTLAGGFGDTAAFSPDGRWVTVDADQPRVYDARTGELQTFALEDEFATGFEWLDEDTLVLIAAETPKSPMRLLTCEVPDGACSEASVLGPPDEVEHTVALPVGMPITG
jgi:hypothetical protein